MRKIFTPAFCLLFVFLRAQQGEFLYTVSLNKFVSPQQAQTQWWHEYLEPQVNAAFLQPLLDAIDNGKVTVYEPVFPFTKAISKEDAHKLLNPEVSDYVEDPETGMLHEVKLPGRYPAFSVVSLSFYEDWNYNAEKRTLEKNVRGIVVHMLKLELGKQEAVALFYVPFQKGVSDLAPQVENITYDMNTAGTPYSNLPNSSMAFTEPKQKAAEDALLQQLANVPPNTKLYEPVFPYANPASSKKTLSPVKTGAAKIRFYESWTIDLSLMCFTKMVHGFVIGNAAFVPLNNFVPPLRQFTSTIAVDTIRYMSVFTKGGTATYFNRQLVQQGDTVKLRNLCSTYCSLVKSGRVPAYRWNYGAYSRNILSPAATDSLFYTYETVYSEDPADHERMIESILAAPIGDEELSGFQFLESWDYDVARQHFSKTVYSTGILRPKRDPSNGEALAFMPFVAVNIPSDSSLAQEKYLLAKHVLVPVQIDFNMENASPEFGTDSSIVPYTVETYSAVPPSQRYLMIQRILDNIRAGKTVAYDSLGNEIPLNKLQEQLHALRNSSWHSEVPTDFIALNEMVFDETWYFNPETGQLYKKVNAITFAHCDDMHKVNASCKQVFTVRMKS